MRRSEFLLFVRKLVADRIRWRYTCYKENYLKSGQKIPMDKELKIWKLE